MLVQLSYLKSFIHFSVLFFQISLDMYWVAESEIIEEKAGRAMFRIHFRKGEDLKHYDFEAPRSVAGTFLTPFLSHQ